MPILLQITRWHEPIWDFVRETDGSEEDEVKSASSCVEEECGQSQTGSPPGSGDIAKNVQQISRTDEERPRWLRKRTRQEIEEEEKEKDGDYEDNSGEYGPDEDEEREEVRKETKRRRRNPWPDDDRVEIEEDEEFEFDLYEDMMEVDENEEVDFDEDTADDILHLEETNFINRASAAEQRRWKEYGNQVSLLKIQQLRLLLKPKLTKVFDRLCSPIHEDHSN